MIVSRTTQHVVNRYSALIELKKYASRWTRTRRKISPIVCRKTSTLDGKRIGGTLSTHLDSTNRRNSVQASTKRGPSCTVFTESLEKSDSHRFLPGKTRNGIRRLLHPAHLGGSGSIPGGAHEKLIESRAHLSS